LTLLITLAAMTGVFAIATAAGMTALTAWDRGRAIVDSQ
jgi:hypothetical protein